MVLLSQPHHEALGVLLTRLTSAPVVWALTGSCSFALQGLPVSVHDIDLQTDACGAYAIEQCFAELVVRPVAYREAATIRSHLGALVVAGVEVEIMGAIQKRLPDGEWESLIDVAQHRQWVVYAGQRVPVLSLPSVHASESKYPATVVYAGQRVPVLSLEYEAGAYLRLGRLEKAQLLRAWLDRQEGDT